MKWLVADSLYCPEAFWRGHLDSYSHYLREYGESAETVCWGYAGSRLPVDWSDECDVAFVLDNYAHGASIKAEKRIAQVAAMCSPMPWEVRKPDGSPAYDLIISSLRWMVEEARKHGCRAEYMSLAFDHRALVAGMNVKERDIPCLFVGSRDANHQKREAVLTALGDLVTIAPPTFGRAYFELLHRARVTIHVGAEWAKGERNAMRLYESAGCRSLVISDGEAQFAFGETVADPEDFVDLVREYTGTSDEAEEAALFDQRRVLTEESYIQRVPELVALARSL